MLIIKNLNLFSVQSWTYLQTPQISSKRFHCGSSFQLSSRCSEILMNTVSRVWYISQATCLQGNHDHLEFLAFFMISHEIIAFFRWVSSCWWTDDKFQRQSQFTSVWEPCSLGSFTACCQRQRKKEIWGWKIEALHSARWEGKKKLMYLLEKSTEVLH